MSNEINNEPVKSYRPLVKDFNKDDTGFDLAKVKMEPGVLQDQMEMRRQALAEMQRKAKVS